MKIKKKGKNWETKKDWITEIAFKVIKMPLEDVENAAKRLKDDPEQYEGLIVPLSEAVQKHYIEPYTQYLDSGEFNTLQDFVGIGRGEVYRIVSESVKNAYAKNQLQ